MLEQISIHAFLDQNKIKTESGTPLDFRDHPYLFDPLSDMASLGRDIVIYKGAQIGYSLSATLAILWIAKNKKIDMIYCLPTNEDMRQFAGGKTNRIIAQNPIFQEWVKDKDTIEQKTVGENIIYFRGTFSSKAAMMVSSDLNVYDEVDACNQEVIEQYATRLQHSKLKRQWYFSHPSVPGNGVSKHWDKSDQKHWFVTCEHCKKEQYISWPDSICLEREVYQCKKCKGEMSDDVRRNGRWVQKYKDRELSGYWIPLLICPRIPAKEIIEYKNTKSDEYFTNKVLGLPYVGGGNKVADDVVYRNLTDEVNLQDGKIVIGVDTGVDIRYVVGNRQGLFYIGECNDYDDLEALLDRWPQAIMVIDQGGDIIGPRKLRQKYPGRVFLCFFQEDKKSMQIIRWGENDELGRVIADRNRLLQLTIDELSDKRIKIHGTKEDWKPLVTHFSHIYRVMEEDAQGVKKYKWLRSDRDDFVLALAYWRCGMDKIGMSDAQIFGRQISIQSAPDVVDGFRAPKPLIYSEEYDEDWRK
jgi:hypothetical protein